MSTKNDTRTNEKKILEAIESLNERLDEIKVRDTKMMKVMEAVYIFMCKLDNALAGVEEKETGIKVKELPDESETN